MTRLDLHRPARYPVRLFSLGSDVMTDKRNDFGLIGLAVMGQNLVLNIESRGFRVSVYNRTAEVTDEFGGRGLATILITEALDDTKAQDRFIVGVCPLVAAFLKKHPEYEPATHPVTPEVLNWLKTG